MFTIIGLAGDNLNLTDSCTVNVTSAEVVSSTYVLSFTIGPLTPDQRDRLAISGQPAALFGDGVLAQIELGGTLDAESCFSPITVSAFAIIVSCLKYGSTIHVHFRPDSHVLRCQTLHDGA